MDGMEEVKERNFRGSRLNGLWGAGKTSSCQQRAKVGGGLLRSSSPDSPRSPMRGGACCPGANCKGPSLTIGCGSRTSLPTPRSVALSVAYRPVSHFVTDFNNYGQNVRGRPPSPPQPTLRDFLASALSHGNPPVAGFTSYPVTVPLWPPLGQSGRSVGVLRRFKPISSELVRHMSAVSTPRVSQLRKCFVLGSGPAPMPHV